MNPTGQDERSLFASPSLAAHLLRGAIGIGLLAFAVLHQSNVPLSVTAGVGALVALRGCPVCWTIGLVETVMRRIRTGR